MELHKQQQHTLYQKGFSIVEMIVVVAIIAILASIVLINISGARGKARDSKRIQNIRQLQNALELYFTSCNSYPVTTPGLSLPLLANTNTKYFIFSGGKGCGTNGGGRGSSGGFVGLDFVANPPRWPNSDFGTIFYESSPSVEPADNAVTSTGTNDPTGNKIDGCNTQPSTNNANVMHYVSFANKGEFQKFKTLNTTLQSANVKSNDNGNASWYVLMFCLGNDNNKWKRGPGYIDPDGIHTGTLLPLFNSIP